MSSIERARKLFNKGPSRPTLYRVVLPSQYGMNDGGALRKTEGKAASMNDYIELFCEEVTVPEARVSTVIALGHERQGIARETAANFIYGKPLTLSLIENSDFDVYHAMRSWLDLTGVNTNSDGIEGIRMNYYKSYVGDIKIEKFEFPHTQSKVNKLSKKLLNEDRYKNPVSWLFKNAYPINIGQVNLASDAIDQYLSFSVTFTYENYVVMDERSSKKIS